MFGLSPAMISLLMTLGLGGLVTSGIYYIYSLCSEYFYRKYFTSVTIENLDPVYKWLLQFLIEKEFLNNSMTDTVVRIAKGKKRNWWEPKKQKEKPKVEYYPAPGHHFFNYKGIKMWAFQEQGKTNIVGYEQKPETQEKIVIICYRGTTDIIRQLIDDAVIYSMDQDKGLLGIYQVVDWLGAWAKVMTKKARTLDSVILDQDIAETLIDDIKKFQGAGEWYMSKGVPYRRGYLLYGPPGTGKTSFVQAISGALKLNLCYLNLSSSDINDDKLNRLLSDSPERSIILLEDVDAMFKQRDQIQSGKLSFSGLLNALDGVRSQEGQILYMTTNHKEKLDPALLRPGRADVHVRLGHATEKQIRELFLRFFPGDQKSAEEFAKLVPVGKLSMAKLQGHLLLYRDDSRIAIERAQDLSKEDFSSMLKSMTIDEWLHRLNLLHYKPHYDKQKIRRVDDLHHIMDQGQIFEHNLNGGDKIHARRLWNMLIGETETKENFKYLSAHGIRSIGSIYITNPRDLNELVQQVPEDLLTGFQLRDIFDSTKKYSEIRKKIYDAILFNKRFHKSIAHSFKHIEEKKEEETKIKKINFDIVKFFNDVGAPECVNKLQKQDLLDPEMFFTVEEGTILSTCELKPEGKKRRVTKKIQEIRAKYEKDGFIEYLDMGLLEDLPESAPVLKFQRSTTIGTPIGSKEKKSAQRSSSPGH